MRFLLIAFSLIIGLSLAAQNDYNTGVADNVKAEREPNPVDFRTGKLPWNAIKSTCHTKPPIYGTWMNLKLKTNQIQIGVHNGNPMGTITNPTIYLGRVVESKTERKLTEVACQSFTGDGPFVLEATGLSPDVQYLILVSSSAEKATFGLSLTEKFSPKPKAPPVVAPAPAGREFVAGRVRDKNGNPKEGILISLVNDQQQPIETANTKADGTFKFERLPPEQTMMARLEEKDSELEVDMFLYDANGRVVQRAVRIGGTLFGFGAEADAFKQLRLLTANDWKLDVKAGKTGIAGRVVDSATMLFAQGGMSVGLYDEAKTKLATSVTDVNGAFQFKDLDGGNYSVKLETDSKTNYTEMVVVDDLNVPVRYANSSMVDANGFFKFEKLPIELVEMKRLEEKDIRMKAPTDFSGMEAGQPIVLKNILFESGSSELLSSSFAELDRLAAELQKRPAVRIEVSGHTDNTGNPATNLLLSESRAESVKNYLVKAGVSASRLQHKGFGAQKPIADNATDEGKRQNRRVEFVMLK